MLSRLFKFLFPPEPMTPVVAVQKLFANHGVTLEEFDGWLSSRDEFPKVTASLAHVTERQDRVSTQLDVEVAIETDRTIVESFSDDGATADEAINKALFNFSSSSLHVLLSAIWQRPQGEQVEIESWDCNGTEWQAHVGLCIRKKSSGDPDVEPPQVLFDELRNLIVDREMKLDLHWVRLFFGNVDSNRQVTEVLFDNEPWETAQMEISSLEWPVLNQYYSARIFLVLEPPR